MKNYRFDFCFSLKLMMHNLHKEVVDIYLLWSLSVTTDHVKTRGHQSAEAAAAAAASTSKN